MATKTETASELGADNEWVNAAIAGLVAGVVFGLMIQIVLGVMRAVGALYTVPGVATGWIAHLVHSVIFALIYAAIVEWEPLTDYAGTWTTGVAVGLGYGVLLWIVNIWFLWPVWLNAVGFPPGTTFPVPYVSIQPLVGHLVYGGLLGALYPLLNTR